MKYFILGSLLFSSSAFAGKGKEIIRKYGESAVVQDLVKSVQDQYGVTCGSANKGGILPTVFGSVWYSTHCEKPGVLIKLKINSTFKNNDEPDFKYERYKLKVRIGNLLPLEDEVFYLSEEDKHSRDPFVNAYRNSQLVRSVSHFVEDQHKVVCKAGKAHKKNANYFYKTNCKSDTTEFTLKVKAKVHVIGDDTFKFKLTKYKVLF